VAIFVAAKPRKKKKSKKTKKAAPSTPPSQEEDKKEASKPVALVTDELTSRAEPYIARYHKNDIRKITPPLLFFFPNLITIYFLFYLLQIVVKNRLLSAGIRKKLSGALADIQALMDRMRKDQDAKIAKEEMESPLIALSNALYLDIRRTTTTTPSTTTHSTKPLSEEKLKELEMGLAGIRQMGGIPTLLEFALLLASKLSEASSEEFAEFGWSIRLLEWICTAPHSTGDTLNVNGKYLLLTNRVRGVVDILLLCARNDHHRYSHTLLLLPPHHTIHSPLWN